MYNGKTVSLKEILWRIMNYPTMADLSFEDAAEYAVEAIGLLGAPLGYENKISPLIEVIDYKAALPENVVEVRGIKIQEDDSNVPLTYATDIFHDQDECDDCNKDQEYTYTYANGVIKTSFEKGTIRVSYKGLMTDEEGFPLIPDNEKFKLAIRYYVMYMHMEPLALMGKVTQSAFNIVSQQKSWYMGAAQSSMQIANMDHAETIANSVNRLLLNRFGHSSSYAGMGKKEIFKKYI